MRQTRAGRSALVDQRVDVVEAFLTRGFPPCLPGLRDRRNLVVAQLGERAHVSGRVHDDLLPLEGGVQVRHDAYRPRRDAADAERLRRSSVLAPFAEGALVELRFGRLSDQSRRGTRPAAPVRRHDDEPPRERVSPKIQNRRCA
jgi:hypothetical protein